MKYILTFLLILLYFPTVLLAEQKIKFKKPMDVDGNYISNVSSITMIDNTVFKSTTQFLGTGQKSVDSDKLDGKDSSEFALTSQVDNRNYVVGNLTVGKGMDVYDIIGQ